MKKHGYPARITRTLAICGAKWEMPRIGEQAFANVSVMGIYQ